MYKNYLTTALRNFKKHKAYSFLNIAGLTLGMSCSLLVFMFVFHELSYDRFHEKADRIFRIIDVFRQQTGTPSLLSDVLLKECPEVETAAKLVNFRNTLVRSGDRSFLEEKVVGADAAFFDVFSFPLTAGDPASVLNERGKAVISESAAAKYFGSENPVGKTITAGGQSFKITGVAADPPENSHFKFDFLLTSQTFERLDQANWLANHFLTYIRLREGFEPEDLERRLDELAQKYPPLKPNKASRRFGIQALTDIHLRSDVQGEFEANGSLAYVYIFFSIAVFILMIACINFVNLSTARSSNRAREVGLRKVVGSKKGQLIGQFLGESLCLSFLALVLALVLIQLLLPGYRHLTGKNLGINYFGNAAVLPGLLGLACLVGFLSGLYPAFTLSSFRPLEALKGLKDRSRKGRSSFLRGGLVIFQFLIAIFLLSGTIVVHQQLRYFQNKKLGFEKEQVLVIHNADLLSQNSQAFKRRLIQQPSVVNVSLSNSLPGKRFGHWGVSTEKIKTGIGLNICQGDEDYVDTLKMEMREGRFFSRDFATDTSAMVINETAVSYLELQEPLGKRISSAVTKKTYTVIGVVKDFHYESLQEKIRPAGFVLPARPPDYVSARIRTDRMDETLRDIKKIWESFSTGLAFEYSFLDEDFDNLYRVEQRIGKLGFLFSSLAIFISCLGLLGLAAFMATQRTKEIAIRKILGASRSGVVFFFSKDFVKWVFGANIIAVPAAYFIMDRWLRNYAYRISLEAWTFVLAGIVALGMAVITVSYQTIKAASANPVDSLRCE